MPSRAADFHTTPAFAGAALYERRAWSGLCLDRMPMTRRPRPSSLYTFTSVHRSIETRKAPAALGSASSCARRRARAKNSPTLSASRSSFPADRLNHSSLLCLPIPPSSHAPLLDSRGSRSSFLAAHLTWFRTAPRKAAIRRDTRANGHSRPANRRGSRATYRCAAVRRPRRRR
jgi:hypothetical protein